MKALIEQWRKRARWAERGDESCLLHNCADELEAAIAKGWPWRSVKDEKPEWGRPVLVMFPNGNALIGEFVCDKYGDGENHDNWDFGDWDVQVDAENAPQFWMYADEIPQPQGGRDAA